MGPGQPTWLGEGNNLLFAQEADSSEYAAGAVTVTVEGFDSDDTGYQSPLVTFIAQDTVLQDKDDNGIFLARIPRVPLQHAQRTRDCGPNDDEDLRRLPPDGGLCGWAPLLDGRDHADR